MEIDKMSPEVAEAAMPIQRWHATGDYAYPAEERADGEFVAYDEHCAEVDRLKGDLRRIAEENARLRKENAILEVKNRGTLANNLCPDHRDKQVGKPCLACTIETLARKKDRAESELADVRRKWADAESKLAACDDDLRHVLAERDALKARIAEAKRGRLTYGPAGIVMVAGMTDENIAEIVGAAVALLKLEDGE